jgi:uncharacterized membrane protein
MPTIPSRRASLLLAAVLLQPLAASADKLAVLQVGPGYATSLSADGRTVVGQAADNFETFRWTHAGGFVRLGRGPYMALGHSSGIPRVSDDGSVVTATIVSDDGTYSTAGRWTVAGGWQMLAPPLPADGGLLDGEDCSAYGLSGNGAVVTGLYWRPGATSGGSAHGMLWTAQGGMIDMGSSGFSSRIDSASTDGSVLAGWDEHPQYGTRRAAVWSAGVETVLDPSDWPSEAGTVNADGTVVLGQAADPAHGFQEVAAVWTWDGGRWQVSYLGALDASARKKGTAYAKAITADGSVVVGYGRLDSSKPNSIGFIWTASTGMVDLSTYVAANGGKLRPGSSIIDVGGMTPDGRVIAVTTQDKLPPYAVRTQLILRVATPAN